MLRNVLLIATTSGLTLFSKEFLNAISQPRMIGGLLTAMMESSVRTTGLPVTYIELSNVAVTIMKDEVVKVCHCRRTFPANIPATPPSPASSPSSFFCWRAPSLPVPAPCACSAMGSPWTRLVLTPCISRRHLSLCRLCGTS